MINGVLVVNGKNAAVLDGKLLVSKPYLLDRLVSSSVKSVSYVNRIFDLHKKLNNTTSTTAEA